MNDNSIIIDGRFDLIKCEIFRENDRPRKCSIITLFDEHALCIKIDRSMDTLSRKGEDISRKCYIYITWIYSSYRSDDDDLLCEIEYIDSDLSYIDLMFMICTDIYLYHFMYIMIRTSIFFRSIFLRAPTDTEEFGHKA